MVFEQEFVFLWNGWIKKIVKPRSALIVVDVQVEHLLHFPHFQSLKNSPERFHLWQPLDQQLPRGSQWGRSISQINIDFLSLISTTSNLMTKGGWTDQLYVGHCTLYHVLLQVLGNYDQLTTVLIETTMMRALIVMMMKTRTKIIMIIIISLDWHPTDHVSFSDNAHLRTIARESKVQVSIPYNTMIINEQ